MNARHLVGLELRRLVRAPGIWISTAVFGLTLALGAAVPALVLSGARPDAGVAYLLGPATDVLLPLIAIVGTYGAIAGSRERGRLKLLLATPLSREEVLSATIVARVVLLQGATALAIIPAILTIWVLYGRPPVVPLAGFAFVTLLVVATYAVIGVSVSASVATPPRALGVLLAGFVAAHALWTPVGKGVHYLLTGTFPGEESTGWFRVFVRLNPLDAYAAAIDGILPPSPHLRFAIDETGVAAEQAAVVGRAFDAVDLFLSLLVLVGWAVLAVAVARARFRRADLA